MTLNQFAALLGFAFVGFWIAEGFGDAILCLIGAGLAYALAGIARGEIDVGEVQSRLRGAPQGAPAAAPPRSRVR